MKNSEKDNKESDEDQENKDSGQEGGSSGGDKAESSGEERKPAPTILAWTVRGISALIILFFVGYFVVKAIQPEAPPSFTFTVKQEKIEQRGNGWVVPVDVTNNGGMGISALKVAATLTQAPEEPSESADIMLLGPGETVTANFWFEQDPRGKGMECSVGSYLIH